jgi:hypothetical protein
MAKLSMNSSDLLVSIKSRAMIPTAQNAFSDDDLLNFATEELNLKLVPSILSVREEFYVTTTDVPLVQNQSNYKIPYRSIGGKVRYLYLSTGDAIEDIMEYQSATYAYQDAGFYLQNDEIVILPTVSGAVSGSLKFMYYLKPNSVVALDRGAQITDINTTTGELTVDAVPSNITPGSQVDLIGSTGNFKTKAFDITPSSVNTTSKIITLASVPSDLQIGDYVCTAGESVIPQVPAELHVMLAQAVACRVLEALGDTAGLTNANAKLTEMEQKLLSVIDSRVEAPGRKITNRNSFFRNRRSNRWYY